MEAIKWEEISRAIHAFNQYKREIDANFQVPRENLIRNLHPDDSVMIMDLWDYKVAKLDTSMDANGKLAKAIAQYSLQFFEHYRLGDKLSVDAEPTASDHAVVRSTIRQFWYRSSAATAIISDFMSGCALTFIVTATRRDWSIEGTVERNSCHQVVLNDLVHRYAHDSRKDIRILIPGAGLARLAFTLAGSGFTVEAIDVSHIQLLATNFILSRTDDGKGRCVADATLANLNTDAACCKFQLYPFATQFSNHIKLNDQFVSCEIPDDYAAKYIGAPTLDTYSDILSFKAERLTLSAKDFVKDFSDAPSIGAYDTVVTVFFVDTARNFLDYARRVHSILKPGGVWINVGPLLWNCYELGPLGRREGDVDGDEDNRTRLESGRGLDEDVGTSWDAKIELSNEEVLELLQRMGFRIKKEEILEHKAGYIQDPKSMLQNKYRLAHWLAQKI